MRGGRIRGQGTYGCVFQPALLCNDANKSRDKSKVGKITPVEDARIEVEISKYLRTVPDSNKYVIIPESDTCIPLPNKQQVDRDIEHCEFSRDIPLEETVQLIMPWGGYPLSRINLDPHRFNFYKFTEDLLTIGAFLVLNDVCHFDIWGQNFLFDAENNPKLIDWGFAFRPSMITFDDLKMRWRQLAVDHDTETPEVTLMIAATNNIPASHITNDLQYHKPTVQRLAALCNVLPSEWSAEVYKWSEDSQSFQQHDWLHCWKLYWPGFDAWSLGAVLLQVLEIQVSIPVFMESEDWKLKGPTIQKLLRGLCKGHPAYRIDAVEALNILTDGSHPLISAGSVGSDWISQKSSKRPPL
jgi:hypothetical protein